MDKLGPYSIYQCPYRYISTFTLYLLELCRTAEQFSVLYTGGGIVDQPVWFMEALRIYKIEINKIIKMDIEKRKATEESKRKMRRLG